MNSVFLAKSNQNKTELWGKRSEAINATHTPRIKIGFVKSPRQKKKKKEGFGGKHTAADQSLCKDENVCTLSSSFYSLGHNLCFILKMMHWSLSVFLSLFEINTDIAKSSGSVQFFFYSFYPFVRNTLKQAFVDYLSQLIFILISE